MDINRSTLEQFYFGVSAAFQGGLGTAESQYEKIAMVVPSGTRENVYPWLGTLPSMQKWAGDRIIRNLKAHKYSIENEKFEMTIAVKRYGGAGRASSESTGLRCAQKRARACVL